VILHSDNLKESSKLKIFKTDKVYVWDETSGMENAAIYRFKPQGKDQQGQKRPNVYFMLTGPNYATPNKDGLGIGSTAEEIRKKYKEPERKLATVNGELWVYKEVILMFGPDQRVWRYAMVQSEP
ncbi:MAG: hypothetical protein AAFZ52_19910, partial [Bacteroidota bacterium]